jgi:polyadenylate-binding protein
MLGSTRHRVLPVRPREASKAVFATNSKVMRGKPLYVALWQPKEVRRATMQAQMHQRQAAASMYGARGVPGAPPFMGADMMYFSGPAGARMFPGFNMPRGAMAGPNMQPGFAPGAPQQGGRPFMPFGMGMGMGLGGMMPGASPRGGPGGNRRYAPTAAAPRGGGASRGRGGGGGGGGRRQPGAGPMPFPQLGVRPMGMPGDGQVPVAPGGETLAPDMLAHASPEERRNIIGERLYALISGPQPVLAGKITGMLLEGMDTSELLHLIESPESLNLRIREAIEVLETHQKRQGAE